MVSLPYDDDPTDPPPQKIMPCPFCESECTTDDIVGDDEQMWYFVLCPDCGATGPPMETPYDAIEEWSERADIDEEDLPAF